MTSEQEYDVILEYAGRLHQRFAGFLIQHNDSVYHKKKWVNNLWELNIALYQLSLSYSKSNNKVAEGSFIIVLKLNKESWYKVISNTHSL